MPASNTRECFTEFIGQKVIGYLSGEAFGLNEDILAHVLIFEDGRGLCINDNGSFFVKGKTEIMRALASEQKKLDELSKQQEALIVLAGRLPATNGKNKPKKGKSKKGQQPAADAS